MKTHLIIAPAILVCILFTGLVEAGPRPGSSQGRDYLINTADLGYWCFGVYTLFRERDVEVGGYQIGCESSKLMGYVGFHAMPWATLYGSFGNTSRDYATGADESAAEYGAGIHVNIFDHMFADPYLIEDRIRLDGYVQYHLSKTDVVSSGETLEDRSASILLSVVSKPRANVNYWPHAVSLYVGAVYSDLESDSLNESDAIGLTAGVEFFVTEGISLEAGVVMFEEMGYQAGIHVDL